MLLEVAGHAKMVSQVPENVPFLAGGFYVLIGRGGGGNSKLVE